MMCMCDIICMLYCIVHDGALLSTPSVSSTPTTTASVDGQSTTTVKPVINSTSTDYSDANIEPTATQTIMNTMSESSLSIDKTPSPTTDQGTPTTPPSGKGMFFFIACACHAEIVLYRI